MTITNIDPSNLATISAIVAALVTVVGNALKIPMNYRSLLAIGFGLILVFIPQDIVNKILTALIIGLTASGVYSQVKPSKFLNNPSKIKTSSTTSTSKQNLDNTNGNDSSPTNPNRSTISTTKSDRLNSKQSNSSTNTDSFIANTSNQKDDNSEYQVKHF